jgi:hypothetical protein
MDVYSHTVDANVKTIQAVSSVVFIVLFEDFFNLNYSQVPFVPRSEHIPSR